MINLDDLNKEQRDAVVSTDGPLLILAGAGSGKTRVLTFRIAFIIDSGLATPNNILAMTFTNKAAGEMKERISTLVSELSSSKRISQFDFQWAGTFHSICVKILRKYSEVAGLKKNFLIYDSSDQTATIKKAMERLKISTKEFNPNGIHNFISSAKNELIDPETYAANAQGYFQQTVADVYPVYQEILKENGALDFDDLIFETIKLLQSNDSVREHFQETFKYILVDEYQDTNHAQYVLIKMLAEKHRNICCVGDDDQSIYAFRGATIRNILNFEKDYPEAKVVKLEQNYRSTKKILHASHDIISKNKRRKEKQLWTENHDGENITIYKAFDEVDEGDWILNKVDEITNGGGNLSEIAILYRTNAQSRSLEEAFLRSAVSYRIVGGVRFYERKEVKDIIAYLRLTYNQDDNVSYERIVNVPRRGLGDKAVSETVDEASKYNMSSYNYTKSQTSMDGLPKFKKFVELIENFITKSQTVRLVDLINNIIEKSGYLESLKDGTSEGESRIENLKELMSVASKYDSGEPRDDLRDFLEEISLLEGFTNENLNEDKVTLMTIHSSKGLEYNYVFIVGMEENLFPHSNSMLDDRELEEERRLAYVAITRAKKKLSITYTNRRKYFGKTQNNPISRFIKDISTNVLEMITNQYESEDYSYNGYGREEESQYKPISLEKGDIVEHEYFGKGQVIKCDFDSALVDFGEDFGQKELMLEFARLKKVNR